jgi:hypothetical protein
MTLTGKVYDKDTKAPLAFAVVAVTDASGNPIQPVKSATTNVDGVFSINVDNGSYLSAKYVGYPRLVAPIVAGKTNFDFDMKSGYTLNTVEIVTTKPDGKKKIPNWVILVGASVLLIGASVLIYKIRKNKK